VQTNIRPRRDDDLPGCVAALRIVQRQDSYPLVWPADPVGWLCPNGVLDAWVCTADDEVVGQLLLRDGGDLELRDTVADAAGVPADRLASVSRLFVAPRARGTGTAARLIDTAVAAAAGRGRRCALDVLDARWGGPTALYERLGWRRVATTSASWWSGPDADRPVVHSYLAPDRTSIPA
jgi:GNAT superfamily N-acetyltransferase